MWNHSSTAYMFYCRSFKGIYGLSCLVCTNIAYPSHCPFVTECGPSEVCFLDQFITLDGNIYYQSGCRDRLRCGAKRSIRQLPGGEIKTCSNCCDKDHCNYGGCGEPDLPSPPLRGPICYNCFGQQTEDGCNRVHVCGPDEECQILNNPTNMDSTAISTRCVQKKCQCRFDVYPETCLPLLSQSMGKRGQHTKQSQQHCVSCCDADLCNRNCTTVQTTTLVTTLQPTTATQPTTKTTKQTTQIASTILTTSASAVASNSSVVTAKATTQTTTAATTTTTSAIVTTQPTITQPSKTNASTRPVTTTKPATAVITTTSTTTTTSTKPPIICSAGFVQYDNSCYYFSTDIKYWGEALQICHGKGGSLVKIENLKKQHFIENHLKRLVTTNSIPPNVWGYYIGAHLENGEWKWADGTLLRWTNWGSSEPDHPQDQIYGFVFLPGHYINNYKWGSHKDMQGTSRYICELSPL